MTTPEVTKLVDALRDTLALFADINALDDDTAEGDDPFSNHPVIVNARAVLLPYPPIEFTETDTGGHCTALHAYVRQYPGAYALITDTDGGARPDNLDTDAYLIGCYASEDDATGGSFFDVVEGRKSLFEFAAEFGMSHIEDNTPTPLLLSAVVSHMMKKHMGVF